MSREGEPIGEPDLHGYVDGRLSEARRREVERALEANAALAQRVRDWQAQADGLRRAFGAEDAAARDALLARLAARRTPVARGRGRAAIAAGVVLALVVGGAGGWTLRGDRNPTEIGRLSLAAESAYRTFANDPSRAIEVSSDDRSELVSWLTQKLGRRITVPDLSAQGYHLMGGRVLAALYGPAALLVYHDAADNRITVYVEPMRIGAPAAMRPIDTASVDGFAWIERQIGYTVMSDGDRARLQSVADQVRADTS